VIKAIFASLELLRAVVPQWSTFFCPIIIMGVSFDLMTRCIISTLFANNQLDTHLSPIILRTLLKEKKVMLHGTNSTAVRHG
jgi:hypothetical protein